MTTDTAPLFGKLELVYVAEFVPTFAPFNFHWYDGVFPPFVGMAVKVTLVPEQIELSASLEVMETDGVSPDETVVVIELLVAVDDT